MPVSKNMLILGCFGTMRVGATSYKVAPAFTPWASQAPDHKKGDEKGFLVDHLLQHLAGLPPDAHAWVDFVTGTLRLPGSYAPAAYRAINQNRWRHFLRKGQNVLGYLRTATMREAAKMGLALDPYNPGEPRIVTKERPRNSPNSPARGTVGLVPLPGRFNWASPETGRGAHSPISDNDYTYQDHLDHLRADAGECAYQPDLEGAIPAWLCLPDGCTIDWQKVARHAVPKLQMAPIVARVLTLRAEGWSRPQAIANASSPQEGRKLRATWRWVERNASRIAYVLQLEEPPATADVKAAGSKNRYAKFVPPGDALKAAIFAKHQVALEALRLDLMPSPSLINPPRPAAPWMVSCAPPDRLIHRLWDGTNLTVGNIKLKADSIEEARQILASHWGRMDADKFGT